MQDVLVLAVIIVYGSGWIITLITRSQCLRLSVDTHRSANLRSDDQIMSVLIQCRIHTDE